MYSSTYCISVPCTSIRLGGPLVISLVFFLFMERPTELLILFRSWSICCNSVGVLANSTTLSANLKLVNLLPCIIMPYLLSHCNFLKISSSTHVKSFGEIGSHCLTSLLRLKVCPSLSVLTLALLCFSKLCVLPQRRRNYIKTFGESWKIKIKLRYHNILGN